MIIIITVFDYFNDFDVGTGDRCPSQAQRLDWELMVDNNLCRSEFVSKVLDEVNRFCLDVGLCVFVMKHERTLCKLLPQSVLL